MGFWIQAFYQLLAAYVVAKVFAPSIPDIATLGADDSVDIKRVLNPEYSVPVVYGEARLGGNIIFYDVSGADNKYLDIVCLVSEGEIQGFNKVFMNDEALPIFDAGTGTMPHGVLSVVTNPLYGKTKADGELRLYINFNIVRNNDWIRLYDPSNGTSTPFIAGTHFTVGATLSDSLTNLVNSLNASSNSIIKQATYTKRSDNTGIHIQYDVGGSTGNNFKIRSELKVLVPGDYGGTTSGYQRQSIYLSGGRDDSFINAYFYNGTDTQSANTQLVNSYPPSGDYKGWTSNSKLSGFSYMYIRMTHNQDLFSGSIPKFSFEVKGRKVLDTRTSVVGYSDNPALCLRDYLLNTRFGKGLDTTALSDTSVNSAANDCDTLRNGFDVDSSPITYKSYTMGGVVDTSLKVKDNLSYFLQAMNGTLPYFDGIYSLKILKAGNPVVSFDSDNIIGEVSLTSNSKSDRLNKVQISFPDKQRHFKSGDAPVSNATYLTEDNNLALERSVKAPYVNYYPQAVDLAELAMNLSRRSFNIAFTTDMSVLEATAGDVVGVTYPTFGWTDKEFRLEKIISKADGLCDIGLSVHTDAYYTLDAKYEQETPSDTTLVNPLIVLKPDIDSIESGPTTHLISIEGNITPRIFITWTNVDSYPESYLIYLKKSTDSNFVEVGKVIAGNATGFYISNVEWGIQYDVGVAVRNGIGYVSALSIASVDVPNPLSGAIYTYPNVTGLELIGGGTDLGKGNSEEFTGQDIRLQWRLSSNNVTFEFGSDEAEAAGATGGIVPFSLSGYRIEIYHLGDTEPRQEYFVTDPNFTYTYDKNFDDGDGSTSRSVKFKIWAVGGVASTGASGESESEAILNASNPQPQLPTSLSFDPRFQVVTSTFIPPIDNDYKGVQIWMGTSTGFIKDINSLVYDGPDSTIDITGLNNGVEYFFVLAPYDGFGKTGLNYSSEYSVTTSTAIGAGTLTDLSNWAREITPVDLAFITANMNNDAISSEKIEGIVAGKIQAGTIASVVNIAGTYTAVGGATPEAVFNKTLAAGDWRMDMGPVEDTNSTYLLRYYNGFDDAHGSYQEAFSVDELGNAKFSGDLVAAGGTFSGALSAATGTFSGSLSAATGTFSGELSAATGTFTGELSATTGTFGGDVTAAGIRINASGNIRGGQTDYATGTGFFLGYSGATYKFSIGSSTDYLKWDGTTLKIAGRLETSGSGKRIDINPSNDNEIHFYGDRGDSVIEELATIGVTIYGTDTVIANFGSTGSRKIGVFGRSQTNKGVLGISSSITGVYGVSTDGKGVRGQSTNDIGVWGHGSTYDFYAAGTGTNYGPFTGAHDGLVLKELVGEIGDLLIDSQLVYVKNISNSIFENTLSTIPQEQSIVGVLCSLPVVLTDENTPAALSKKDIEDADNIESIPIQEYTTISATYNLITMNALGEGMVNVCGENGNILAGDYICSSNIAGKGMKQDDNILHNYTVAKAREGVSFSSPTEVKQVACIYLCG